MVSIWLQEYSELFAEYLNQDAEIGSDVDRRAETVESNVIHGA